MAALRDLGFQPGDGTWEFGMSDKLLFGVNESRLADGQAANIARIARTLLSVDIRRGRVEGHTDDTGAAAYNDALSQRRAAAVAEAMIAAGMQRQDIAIEGTGARRPIEDNRSAGGRRENRRVVIVVDAE
ncbi:hypothetical protein STHU_17320 [Allostella humosa]|nr:OmpA family protein [Stella humosa]BBK31098.1 hypothetical protein STHU_17320 [Stella humosa]